MNDPSGPISTQPPLPTTPPQPTQEVLLYQQMLALKNQAAGGLSWFYWLAGLSILNSLISIFGQNITFFFGLSVTQIVDGMRIGIAQNVDPQLDIPLKIIGFVINLVIAGVFALFGYLGIRGFRWAVFIGMGLYFFDALLSLAFGDYLGILFHAWVFYGLIRGLIALNKLRRLQQSTAQASAFSPV